MHQIYLLSYNLQVNLSIFEIVLFIMFVDFTKYTTGVTHCYNIGRNIFCNHTSSTNHSIISNSYSRKNNHTSTKPTIISYMSKWTCFPPQFAWNGGSMYIPLQFLFIYIISIVSLFRIIWPYNKVDVDIFIGYNDLKHYKLIKNRGWL